MFDHERDLMVMSFWPVFAVELSDTDMRLSQSMCFVVGIISGSPVSWDKFSFQTNVQFTAAPYLEVFYGTKQNRYTLEM